VGACSPATDASNARDAALTTTCCCAVATAAAGGDVAATTTAAAAAADAGSRQLAKVSRLLSVNKKLSVSKSSGPLQHASSTGMPCAAAALAAVAACCPDPVSNFKPNAAAAAAAVRLSLVDSDLSAAAVFKLPFSAGASPDCAASCCKAEAAVLSAAAAAAAAHFTTAPRDTMAAAILSWTSLTTGANRMSHNKSLVNSCVKSCAAPCTHNSQHSTAQHSTAQHGA
jgi:hypothetical protein